jgi:hypothetical protein
MTTSARELVGWTEQRWTAVQEAVDKALARTAKCRQVVPKAADQIGEKAVVVPNIAAGAPLAYGADTIASPVHVYVDVRLDDQHVEDEAAVLRLIEAGASQLGVLEDDEVIQGAPAPAAPAAAAAAAGGGAAAAAAAPVAAVAPAAVPAAPGRGVRAARNAGLLRGRIGRAPGAAAGGAGTTPIGAGGAAPTGQQIMTAIATAVADLETAGRPGPSGLLLHNRLVAILRVPPVAGAAPLIQQVEQLIGSSEIVGTSALDGSLVAGRVCGILFRLEPAAIDVVHTQKPTVTVLGRAGGQTDLRIEEEIVVRVMDQTAVHRIEY